MPDSKTSDTRTVLFHTNYTDWFKEYRQQFKQGEFHSFLQRDGDTIKTPASSL
jgi:hypothetical protein